MKKINGMIYTVSIISHIIFWLSMFKIIIMFTNLIKICSIDLFLKNSHLIQFYTILENRFASIQNENCDEMRTCHSHKP